MTPNLDFVTAVNALMVWQELTKNDPVIVMCRSGDRSSRAANLLQEADYTRVYSVDDGFEGDMDKEGHRDVNGWNNAGLPWAYKMTESQAYLALSAGTESMEGGRCRCNWTAGLWPSVEQPFFCLGGKGGPSLSSSSTS